MELSREQVIERLRAYVDMPSGSHDLEGLSAFISRVEEDMRELGFDVVRYSDQGVGDTLVCTYGSGRRTLLLLGHMDTVFTRENSQKLFVVDEDTVSGSGVMDMKGGLLIMQEALRRFLPTLPEEGRVVCVLSGDEEIGAGFSSSLISSCAKDAFACLSYEPMRESGALVRSRKGVISFTVRCTGVSGHAGAAYLTSASAIQQLCAVINRLYTLRDDARNVSVNIGVIHGGTASNVVCDEAVCEGELRYYDPALTRQLLGQLNAICLEEGVTGTETLLTIHASHPPFEANEKSGKLLALVQKIAKSQGIELQAEDTGGAGDIAYASIAGAASLDGLGLQGTGMHTLQETGTISSFMQNVKLSAALMQALFDEPDVL